MSKDNLYHYTTQKGLLGIIGKGGIWATNIFYLNDAAEFEYAFRIFSDKIKARINRLMPQESVLTKALKERGAPSKKDSLLNFLSALDASEQAFYEELLFTVEYIKKIHPIYVCSFSEKEDNLSQWRGYCSGGNGYSIGFNKSLLIKQMKKKGFDLAECIYEKEKQGKKINELIDEAISSLSQLSDGGVITATILKDVIIEAAGLFSILAPKIKDSSFEEEKEWRFTKLISGAKNILFRKGRSMIIPYVPVDLRPLPISEIIVGPTPHRELAKNSVTNLLEKKDIKAEVNFSKIPYRDW